MTILSMIFYCTVAIMVFIIIIGIIIANVIKNINDAEIEKAFWGDKSKKKKKKL